MIYEFNRWYFTPICMFGKGAAINTVSANGYTLPNRFLRPAYFRTILNKQTKASSIEVLSPAQYEEMWKEQLRSVLLDMPIEVIKYAFPTYSISLSKYNTSSRADIANYVLSRLWKDRSSRSDSVVEVILEITPANLHDGAKSAHFEGRDGLVQLLLSALTEKQTDDVYSIRLMRELLREEITWQDMLNAALAGELSETQEV